MQLTAGQAARLAAEQRHILDSLGAELGYWRSVSRSGCPLEKHRSQVDAVVTLLSPGLEDAELRLADGRGDQVPGQVLDLFHIWDFFRGRFMLRQVRDHRRWLDAADELAWECYRPVMAVAGGPPREPVLVGLGRDASPRAHRRGSVYRELLPRGGVHTRQGRAAAQRLPFPVVDVPWYCVGHLPAVLTVAHEVAHHIEDDFALTAELRSRTASAGLPSDRAAVWIRWASEVFADACAAVLCGPAFTTVLADTLAALPADAAQAPDGPHPPPDTRVSLSAAAAELAGHPAVDGPPGVALADATGREAAAVAEALLRPGWPQLGGLSLLALLAPERPVELPAAAQRLLRGFPSRCTTAAGVLSAAAWAFQLDPDGYDRRGVGAAAVAEVLRLRPPGSRAGRAAEATEAQARRRERDLETGRMLLAALAQTAESPPPDPARG
ncbi:hypothetical protein ACWGCW_21015 [Streptomyces sp. NPDC054933]